MNQLIEIGIFLALYSLILSFCRFFFLSGRYREFAEFLGAEYNICTIVHDARGHGKSSGQRGFIGGMPELFSDIDTILDFAKDDKHPSVPVFVLAHSFGGMTFLDYARDNMKLSQRIQGSIITCPFVDFADHLDSVKVTVTRILGTFLPRLSLPVEELPAKNLTSDPVKQKEHDEDPANLHYFTVGWGLQTLNTQVRLRETTPLPIATPVLYIVAENDKVSDVEAVKKTGESIEQKDKTIVVRKGEEHEVLNETKREETYRLIGDWIKQRV